MVWVRTFMQDFLGNPMPISEPPKFEFNKNEISITAVEQEALLRGLGIAYEEMLREMKAIPRPSKALLMVIDKIENEVERIRQEHGNFKPQ